MSKTELELAIEEIEKMEGVEEETPDVEPEPTPEPEPQEEEPTPEAVVEPVAELEKPAHDHAAIARANYEAREAKRIAAELKAELEALKNPPKPIPDATEDWEGHIATTLQTALQKIERMENEQKYNQQIGAAAQEFLSYESEAKKTIPDYEEASNYLSKLMDDEIKREYPDITPADFAKVKQIKILEKGKFAVNQGINPAHYIYAEASLKGYKSIPKQNNEPPKLVKSNLSAVAENRKKSAGMAASSSSGTPKRTMSDLENMTNAERWKLKPEDWDALEA